ncbi:MAG: histidine--tRNA ligase [Legionella sp.]
MVDKIQAIRGMNDILPAKTPVWRYVENILTTCLRRYGYHEVRFPLVESTQLFKRTIGEVTDIVEKEMYTFDDLNGDSLTLRPEGTAGCVRACIENGLLYNQTQKLWYMGPMFRHERPQKGRYRQFNQLGVEVFGIAGASIELELILLCRRMWQELGFTDQVQLQINTLGTLAERQQHKIQLVEYLRDHFDDLDQDSKNRLDRNPLRVLDSKNPQMQELIANAPKLLDSLGEESTALFQSLCSGLDTLGISYQVNPVLVRGLDYYGHTVFEWVTDKLGSQATICAGGRYDILVEHLGGMATPAVGFAMGIERLLLLMETLELEAAVKPELSVFIMVSNEANLNKGLELSESLRSAFPEMQILMNTVAGSLKSQFKKADKSGARLALILGDDEIQNNQVSIKDLRKQSEQITVDVTQLNHVLSAIQI